MLAALDVHYGPDDTEARAACVLFEAWDSDEVVQTHVVRVGEVAPYVAGEFYRRELPPLLAVLAPVEVPLEVVLVDGYVWLGDQEQGLGARLFEALDERVPVVGVAKNRYAGQTRAVEVLRGQSARPLWVSAIGLGNAAAAERVAHMHGAHRLPTMLRHADQLSKGTA